MNMVANASILLVTSGRRNNNPLLTLHRSKGSHLDGLSALEVYSKSGQTFKMESFAEIVYD